VTEPKSHPAAELFPMMTDIELRELADDIQKNGLLEPIIIYRDMVLDGRNRLVACKLAGVPPKFQEANGETKSPTLYVISKNLHRRHLTISQRAAIGAETVPMLAEETKQREHDRKIGLFPFGNSPGRSCEIVAETLGIGATSVTRATAVKKASPELFEKMKTGEITAGEAERIIKAKPEEKREVYEAITSRQQQLANKQKRRMGDALSMVNGCCTGLATLKVPMVFAVCDLEERKIWATKARECAAILRRLARKLEDARGTADNGAPL